MLGLLGFKGGIEVEHCKLVFSSVQNMLAMSVSNPINTACWNKKKFLYNLPMERNTLLSVMVTLGN